MSSARISVVFGTRPEAIKLAPVISELRRRGTLAVEVCVTGQHRQMLDQTLSVFDIAPDTDFNLMQPNQTLAGLTSRTLAALGDHLGRTRPDLVIVQGDTTSVLSASLAAFYEKIPVAHVEAGLRTGTIDTPFPEEMNRVVTSRLCTLHFAPTQSARENLIREGVSDKNVLVTGNTVVDALMHAVKLVRRRWPEIKGLDGSFDANAPFVLITGHRRENFGEGFLSICRAIAALAAQHPNVNFVYPVHLNPNVREPVFRELSHFRNVYLIEPLGYLPFVFLMDRCTLILTDSGGVQEEAPSLGKPVLVMRSSTERGEAVAAGCARLVGTNSDTIFEATSALLRDEVTRKAMVSAGNPYGDGKAAIRIADACVSFLAASRSGRQL